MALDVETSKSFTGGFVWSPARTSDLAVDYYAIEVKNQVQVLDCMNGSAPPNRLLPGGGPTTEKTVDGNSPHASK